MPIPPKPADCFRRIVLLSGAVLAILVSEPAMAGGPNWQKTSKEVDILIAKSRRFGGDVHARKARALLQTWWEMDEVPNKIRLQRAALLQRDHQFEKARADLDRILIQDPKSTEAWLMKTTILTVSGQYEEARKAAVPLFALASPLLAVTAGTAPTSCNGHLDESFGVLLKSVKNHPDEAVTVRCWAHTALAEMAVRMGKSEMADEHFRSALLLDPSSPYLLKNFSTFLLEAGAPAKAANLIRKHREFFPVVWMRIRQAQEADEAEMASLMAKYEDRLKKENSDHGHSHGRDEAIYYLEIKGDVREALHQAGGNWVSQREAADLLILVKAAVAAEDDVTLADARRWVDERGFEDVRLKSYFGEGG